MTVTSINKVSEEAIYHELLLALGSENNPSQWLEFMYVMRERLPFLVGSGAPTKKQIENSMIGSRGFKSWNEMVATPVANSGLGWSINTWNKWNQAFGVVTAHPYLKSAKLTYLQVLALKRTFKEDFPQNMEELEKAQADLKAQKVSDEAEKVTALKARVLELEQQLITANAKVDVLMQQGVDVAEQQRHLVKVEQKLAVLSAQNEQTEQQNAKLSEQLRAAEEKIKPETKLGRFEHLVKFFTG